MTPEQKIHRANRVREVLENEEYQSAVSLIEEELTEAWKLSPQRDVDGREKLFQALTMLRKIKQALDATMDSGKLALIDLRHQNPTMREQSREFLGMNTSR